jgi:hypothetical protein
MNAFAHFICRFLPHILVFTLFSSLCLAAEGDDVRRNGLARPSGTRAASTDPSRHLPPPAGFKDATRSAPRSGRPESNARASKATFRSVRRLMRTRRLLLAALRVWELKNGYGS